MHIVLTRGSEGTFHGVNLMYTGEQGIRWGDHSWYGIMDDTEINQRAFYVTLEDGEVLDSRQGMTKANYEAMAIQVAALDPEARVDEPHYFMMDGMRYPIKTRVWLTGEKPFPDSRFRNNESAFTGAIEEGRAVRYGAPCTLNTVSGLLFRPAVIIAEPRPVQ